MDAKDNASGRTATWDYKFEMLPSVASVVTCARNWSLIYLLYTLAGLDIALGVMPYHQCSSGATRRQRLLKVDPSNTLSIPGATGRSHLQRRHWGDFHAGEWGAATQRWGRSFATERSSIVPIRQHQW